jgi:hypothetical protein
MREDPICMRVVVREDEIFLLDDYVMKIFIISISYIWTTL